ncbi:hypothetical protein [Clostridium saccharoperbutylacetonicum]|uniref:hypothetical protein n=1 Tax=Clostridium saccharoperbutylacetonicum TaxID=36745 RepID=UPI000983BC25|nr:hypothetical protein [Clostridium saccharoperbutylacetonicum]AQR98059.1 hypothetical protein CLSAP_54100 [Clostridium saccharoperbutylacetonicum]NSB33952.1 hypothetical protein [Clostridium saccharoperbutylacetonicum]
MCKKIKTTITLAPHIKEFASKEAKSLGLDFSAYLTILIAEKMRATMLTSPVRNTAEDDNAKDEIALDNKQSITIDSEQENEIDRLLQW